jgi:hypothetical protein
MRGSTVFFRHLQKSEVDNLAVHDEDGAPSIPLELRQFRQTRPLHLTPNFGLEVMQSKTSCNFLSGFPPLPIEAG